MTGHAGNPRGPRHGSLTARERIDLLFDAGSFLEWGADVQPATPLFGPAALDAAGDGIITGVGTIEGQQVFAFAQDFAVLEGTLGERGARKLVDLLDRAVDAGSPVVGLLHGNGARVGEGLGSLEASTDVFHRLVVYGGRVPIISVVMGFCAGFAAYLAALSDLVIMVERTSFLVTTSPAVVRLATNQRVRLPELGGARMHAEVSGVAHLTAPGEHEAIARAREAVGLLSGASRPVEPPLGPMPPLPEDPQSPYDVLPSLCGLADGGRVFELKARWGRSAVTALIRLGGRVVGVVANQPLVDAGAITPESARKMTAFIALCEAHFLPLVFLIDVPGIMPGVAQEQAGILAAGAALYKAVITDVPRVTVITRKCYGGAYGLLNSKTGGGALVLAYPQARIGVVGEAVAMQLLGSKLPEDERDALAEAWRREGDALSAATARGIVDRVIAPENTRAELIAALSLFPPHAPHSRLRRTWWHG